MCLSRDEAVEQTAPDSFRIQYDFNHNRSLGVVLPILKRLEKSWVVGCVEDPLVLSDIDGWRRLREKTDLPLYMHVPPLGGMQEMLHGLADGYIIGEYCGGFGDALHRGFAYSKANIPSVIQLTGGTLITAFALHLGAVLPKVAQYHHARRQLRRGSGGDSHSRHRRLLPGARRAGAGRGCAGGRARALGQ